MSVRQDNISAILRKDCFIVADAIINNCFNGIVNILLVYIGVECLKLLSS